MSCLIDQKICSIKHLADVVLAFATNIQSKMTIGILLRLGNF